MTCPPLTPPRSRWATVFLWLAGTLMLSACDSIKSRLNPPTLDAAWPKDSAFLAQAPTLLLRAVRTSNGTRVVPVGTLGSRGARDLDLSERGWRALDVQLLHEGKRFVPYRGSGGLTPIASRRGMWEGAQLDSLTGCQLLRPGAAVEVPAGVELLTTGARPVRTLPNALGDGELQSVLNTVSTLVAPSAGVSMSQMSRYARTVWVVGTGATSSPTIVVSYDDPRDADDGESRLAARPRQVIIVLDKGAYGYKPSLTVADVTTARVWPRRKFLGALDGDGDGRAELYFGLGDKVRGGDLVTYSYRFSGDSWLPDWEFTRTRCLR